MQYSISGSRIRLKDDQGAEIVCEVRALFDVLAGVVLGYGRLIDDLLAATRRYVIMSGSDGDGPQSGP